MSIYLISLPLRYITESGETAYRFEYVDSEGIRQDETHTWDCIAKNLTDAYNMFWGLSYDMTLCFEFLGPMNVDIYEDNKRVCSGSLYDYCCDNERTQEQYADAHQCLKNDCPYSWTDLPRITLVRRRLPL